MIEYFEKLPESDPFLKQCLNYNPWHSSYTKKQPETGRDPNETDRGGWRGYDRVYSHYLNHMKNESFSLMEIGVHSGYGLLAWAKFFEKATILGVEIDEKQWSGHYTKLRQQYNEYQKIKINFFNSTVADLWQQNIGEQTFDVIIDDGSHLPKDQTNTLSVAWNYLKPGGLYFIEDISSRYFNPSKKLVFDAIESILDKRYYKIYSHVNEGWGKILSNPEVWSRYGVTEKTPREFTDYIAVIQKE